MKIYSLMASAALLVLVASCTAGTQGIFASLEREQKVVSLGGLAKTATVTSMAELTTTNPHLYFLTGGRNLFTKPAGAVTWNKQIVNGSSEVVAVGSVGTGGTKVFVVATVNSAPGLYFTTDGSTWTAVPIGDSPSGLLPVRNADGVTNDQLIVVTYNTNLTSPSYEHVYLISSAGTISGPIDLLGPTNVMLQAQATAANPSSPNYSPLNGIGVGSISAVYTGAMNTPGSPYFLANENFLWKIDGSFSTVTAISVSGPPTTGYQGLLYFGSTLYLSTLATSTGGGLYSVSPGASTAFGFTAITTGTTVNNNPVWFSQLLYNTANNSLWIATGSSTITQGTGYMEYSLTTGSFSKTPTTDSSNYNSTVLPSSAVGVLWADYETNPTYFLGTLSQGLWGWTGTTTPPGTWIQQ